MVYLYSIISGFRAILGSQAIQAAMAITIWLNVDWRGNPCEVYDDLHDPNLYHNCPPDFTEVEVKNLWL